MSKISELSDGGVIQGGDTLIAVRSGGNVKVTYGGSTTANIDGGTIDGTVIGGSTAAAVTTTALVATTADINAGTIDGTVIGGSTAAAGTFTTFTSTGIDDNATSTAITIDASENVGINVSSPLTPLQIRTQTNGNVGFQNSTSVSGGVKINAFNDAGSASVPFELDGSSLQFNIASAEKMRIDSSGNVGIGTSSPGQALAVESSSVGVTRVGITNTGNAAAGAGIQFITKNGDTQVSNATLRTDNAGNFSIFTGTTGEAERMRIDSSGNLLVGTTSTLRSNKFLVTASSFVGGFNVTNGTGEAVAFYSNGTAVGSVSVTGSATTYNTSSDERLKENITDALSGNVDDIKVRSFDWKVDGSHQDYGMVAQELEAVAPYAVTKGETEDDMWSVDYSKLVPMLIKEIQDLKAEVAALKGAN